jgi:5-methylcytosine-specific restriction endonuclease McrA
VVHVDEPVLVDPDAPGQSALDDGSHVSAEISRRLACDAGRVVMRHDPDGRVVEVGARIRTIPPALRRALQHRDHGCRFPGCGLPFTDGHHIRHWANGGPTTLSNLVLLCRRHHRAVHEQGFTVEHGPDGELTFHRPNGRALPDSPRSPQVFGDVVEVLRHEHDGDTACPHTRIASAGWSGDRLDLDHAITVLHPLALVPSRLVGAPFTSFA